MKKRVILGVILYYAFVITVLAYAFSPVVTSIISGTDSMLIGLGACLLWALCGSIAALVPTFVLYEERMEGEVSKAYILWNVVEERTSLEVTLMLVRELIASFAKIIILPFQLLWSIKPSFS